MTAIDIAAHAELACEFNTLVERNVVGLVDREGLPGVRSVAERVGQLTRSLCGVPGIKAWEDTAFGDHEQLERAVEIGNAFEMIEKNGADLGGTVVFDFGSPRATRPGQRLWPQCDRGGLVGFVVIPSYMVFDCPDADSGRRLSAQTVYTVTVAAPAAASSVEPVWLPGDIVVDRCGEVYRRAGDEAAADGLPWARRPESVRCLSAASHGGGEIDEFVPQRPLTLLVRDGRPVSV